MEDFLEGFGITQNKLAVSIGVPPRRINEIVHGKRGITADTAIRLARVLRDVRGVLDEPAVELRVAARTAGVAREGRCDHAAADRMTGCVHLTVRRDDVALPPSLIVAAMGPLSFSCTGARRQLTGTPAHCG